MKILMISSVEHQSGSGLRFRGCAGALAGRGHEVHLLEPVPAGADAETPDGVHRQPCPRLPVRPEWQAGLWTLHGMAAVRRVRPDVVWALKPLPNAWVPAWIAGRRGARTAVDFDDLDHGYYRPGPVRAFLERCFAGAAASADDATTHTQPMAEKLTALRGEARAPVFVEQGVDPERFRPAPADAALRDRLGLGSGPVLLYAGHLGPASDLGPLLPELARVAAGRPDARLLVVGDGRESSRLREIAEAVLPPGFAVFAGGVAHRDAPAYYSLATVALNYLEDNEANRYRASIKLREALASGVPVVTSRTPDAERFAAFVRFPEGPGAGAFAEAVGAELAAPDRARADAGREWLIRHGSFAAAVAALAERWEGRSA